jgi:ribosomal protein S18 acetylase RimI-like enzyme
MYSTSLRLALPSDASDLHKSCFPEQTLEKTQEYLRWCLAEQTRGRLVCLVAEENGQAVAIGQLALLRNKGEIGSLVVSRDYRRKGIGTALVQALIEQARQRHLHTLEITANVNTPWIRAWYERLGFTYRREHDFPGERVALLTMDLTQGDQT